MAHRNYGARLGFLEDSQFQKALGRFGLGKLLGTQPIGFGLFGQNIFVSSTTGEYVLRGCPHYDWQFPTEAFFVDLIHRQSKVPVPYPYLYEGNPEVFGWPYVLMPRMPGLQLADPAITKQLSPQDRLEIAAALGRNLAELQRVGWPYSGKYNAASEQVEAFPSFAQLITQTIQQGFQNAQSLNANTGPKDRRWLEQTLTKAEKALEVPFSPTVVMEDYKEGNTVVEKNQNTWQVSGLFDFMTCYFGDGEVDLSRQTGAYLRENPALADAFNYSYLSAKPPREGFEERFAVYMLLDSLIIWDFCQREYGGIPENKTQSLRDWATPLVDYLPSHL